MASKKKKTEVTAEAKTEDNIIKVESDGSPRFTLKQLIESNRYKKYAYILEVKLVEGETYTLREVDELISGMI